MFYICCKVQERKPAFRALTLLLFFPSDDKLKSQNSVGDEIWTLVKFLNQHFLVEQTIENRIDQ